MHNRNQETGHSKLPLLLLKFCLEISMGIAYLSGKQFVHRDLAVRNVLVSEKCLQSELFALKLHYITTKLQP